jgi:hypothetical protein
VFLLQILNGCGEKEDMKIVERNAPWKIPSLNFVYMKLKIGSLSGAHEKYNEYILTNQQHIYEHEVLNCNKFMVSTSTIRTKQPK